MPQLHVTGEQAARGLAYLEMCDAMMARRARARAIAKAEMRQAIQATENAKAAKAKAAGQMKDIVERTFSHSAQKWVKTRDNPTIETRKSRDERILRVARAAYDLIMAHTGTTRPPSLAHARSSVANSTGETASVFAITNALKREGLYTHLLERWFSTEKRKSIEEQRMELIALIHRGDVKLVDARKKYPRWLCESVEKVEGRMFIRKSLRPCARHAEHFVAACA